MRDVRFQSMSYIYGRKVEYLHKRVAEVSRMLANPGKKAAMDNNNNDGADGNGQGCSRLPFTHCRLVGVTDIGRMPR